MTFFSLSFLGKKVKVRGKKRQGEKETWHTLIRQGSQPLLFHLSGFISAFVLDFFFVQPLTSSRAGDSTALAGEITPVKLRLVTLAM